MTRHILEFELSEEAYIAMQDIKMLLEVETGREMSNSELFRSSLRLTRWYLEHIVLKGYTLALANEDTVMDVKILFFGGENNGENVL